MTTIKIKLAKNMNLTYFKIELLQAGIAIRRLTRQEGVSHTIMVLYYPRRQNRYWASCNRNEASWEAHRRHMATRTESRLEALL
jgi:hypothetical protein